MAKIVVSRIYAPMRQLARKLVIFNIGTDLVADLSAMRKSSLIGRALHDNVLVV